MRCEALAFDCLVVLIILRGFLGIRNIREEWDKVFVLQQGPYSKNRMGNPKIEWKSKNRMGNLGIENVIVHKVNMGKKTVAQMKKLPTYADKRYHRGWSYYPVHYGFTKKMEYPTWTARGKRMENEKKILLLNKERAVLIQKINAIKAQLSKPARFVQKGFTKPQTRDMSKKMYKKAKNPRIKMLNPNTFKKIGKGLYEMF